LCLVCVEVCEFSGSFGEPFYLAFVDSWVGKYCCVEEWSGVVEGFEVFCNDSGVVVEVGVDGDIAAEGAEAYSGAAFGALCLVFGYVEAYVVFPIVSKLVEFFFYFVCGVDEAVGVGVDEGEVSNFVGLGVGFGDDVVDFSLDGFSAEDVFVIAGYSGGLFCPFAADVCLGGCAELLSAKYPGGIAVVVESGELSEFELCVFSVFEVCFEWVEGVGDKLCGFCFSFLLGGCDKFSCCVECEEEDD